MQALECYIGNCYDAITHATSIFFAAENDQNMKNQGHRGDFNTVLLSRGTECEYAILNISECMPI